MRNREAAPYCPFSVMGPGTRCDQGIPFRDGYLHTDNPTERECLAYFIGPDPIQRVMKWGCRRLIGGPKV